MVLSLPISIPSMGYDAASLDSPSTDTTTTDSSAFAEIPLTALSRNTKRQLSNSLNSKKILRSEEGYERDWRGIASLARLKGMFDENALSGDDAMTKILQLWCSNRPKSATFANLERYLGVIDRWDVCDDIYENLSADAKNYNHQIQRQSLTLSEELEESTQFTNTKDDFGSGSDPNILTKDDVLRAQKGLPPQKYDAFVLFASGDIEFVAELLTKLEENTEYNFKLCLKDRDLLAGISFAHVALTQLIEERCKHLIVILTEKFFRSPENKFLVDYTQQYQIQENKRKIIPLIYEDSVVIPRTLKIYTHLKYNTSASSLFNFWDKLATSIRNVNVYTETPSPIYAKSVFSMSSSPRQTHSVDETQKYSTNLSTLPTPPTDIPSISINGHALVPGDDDVDHGVDVKKDEGRFKFKKRSSLRTPNTTSTNLNPNGSTGSAGKVRISSNGFTLRNALSTSQLHVGYNDVNSSLSDLSTSSGCSDTKKKKKWPSRLFKKVFSRSSTKLQETA